jgi:hypothetical protein
VDAVYTPRTYSRDELVRYIRPDDVRPALLAAASRLELLLQVGRAHEESLEEWERFKYGLHGESIRESARMLHAVGMDPGHEHDEDVFKNCATAVYIDLLRYELAKCGERG